MCVCMCMCVCVHAHVCVGVCGFKCVVCASVRSSLWSVIIGMIHNIMVIHLIEAVHRYESRRRLFNDNQPQRKQKAEEVKRSSQKRKLQQRVSTYTCTIHHVIFSSNVFHTLVVQEKG